VVRDLSRTPGGAASAPPLLACDLGPTPYRAGLALQEALVQARAAAATGDWLLLCEHEPVLTIGRSPGGGSLRADAAELEARGIELIEVTRGGDVTWHGPGQLVGYPVCDLAARGRDLHAFLRGLEEALIAALETLGVHGHAVAGRTGVWVGERKIASIGIAVRHWVSYHGFALNVAPDLGFFDLIHPCGLRGIQMTSVAAERGAAAPPVARVREQVAAAFASRFGYPGVRWTGPEDVERVVEGARASLARTGS